MSVSVPARGRRHPITAVIEARRLAAMGWNDVEISGMLLKGGFVTQVSKGTVARWVRADAARRWQQDIDRHAGDRAAERGSAPMGPRDTRPEFRLARMRALRDTVRLKDAQIARLMSFDFGVEVTDDVVARALATNRCPVALR